MSTKSNYPNAIKYLGVLERAPSDSLLILREIAKHQPSVIVRAYEKIFPIVTTVIEEEIYKLALSGKNQDGYANKILCIKLHREKTGMGLKESKEAVEALFAKWGF